VQRRQHERDELIDPAALSTRTTEDRGAQPLPGGQLARRAVDAMAPAERDHYASDWERLDARQQAAYEAMSAPARGYYADWRADFERANALSPAEATAEHAADLLGALIASAVSPEGLVGFVPPTVNGLAIVKQAPKLAQQLTDLVNATVQSARNRLGRNALPEEVETALRNNPVYRVWGDGARPWGRSWTTADPKRTPDYRDLTGLPDANSGRFLSSGIVRDATGISRKSADPLHGNRRGLDELLIPEAESKIDLHRVEGLNPEF